MPRKDLSSVLFKISAWVTLSLVFAASAFAQSVYVFQFQGKPAGSGPLSPLLADGAGNLYGTTFAGGTFGYGSIYELMASGGEKILYSFTGGADGANPSGELLSDGAGNFFGTASAGGNLSA